MSRKRKIVRTLILGLLLASMPTVALCAENNSIDRVYGEDRYDTMLQIALKLNPRTSDTIVLASGNNFPDALAGVPLAHQKNAPILLVDSTPEESQEAFSYIKDHFDKQGTVYILGGDVVIPNTFVDQLVKLGVQKENIHRLGGWDRYETAVAIAKQIEHKGSKFYVVSGESFPDALSASVLAATSDSSGVPILLVPSGSSLPDSVVNYLNGLPGEDLSQSFEVVGGTVVVSEESINVLKQKVKRISTNGVIRKSGIDRYETMKIVNSTEKVVPNIYLASGENYPDALAGAVLAARDASPIVLVNNTMPEPTSKLLLDYYGQNAKNTVERTQMTVIGGAGIISDNTVMLADYAFNYGRKASSEGRVSTLAGSSMGYRDGESDSAQFAFPYDAVQGANGTLYVSDTQNHLIRAVDPNGNVVTYAGVSGERDDYGNLQGGYADGAKQQARFNEPKGLAIDKTGAIYVADSGNGAIRVLQTNGEVSTLIKGLNYPSDLVFGENGVLYVSETMNHRIIKVNPDGSSQTLVDQLNEPSGLSIFNGILYVADTGNQRICSVTTEGVMNTVAGSAEEMIQGTSYLKGGLTDGKAEQARFNFPHGVAVSSDGTIYVADTYNHAVRVLRKDGTVETLAGNGEHGNQCGFLEQARFDGPTSVLLTSENHLLILDQMNHQVRKVQP